MVTVTSSLAEKKAKMAAAVVVAAAAAVVIPILQSYFRNGKTRKCLEKK
jgi:ABC-type glycerol-3-phosphate transport system permease component